MKFDKKYISKRYTWILVIAMFVCAAILVRAIITMTAERQKWQDVGSVYESESQPVKPNRGNIISSDGQLMASSLPDYKVYIDFLSGGADKDTAAYNKRDTLFHQNLDTICDGLSKICPTMTSAEYKEHLEKGWKEKKRFYEICPHQVLNFIQYNQLIKLPVFNIPNKNKSGLIVEERNNRKKPFGSLAKRTLGEMFGAKDSARSGIELAYDSLLRGKSGLQHRKKVLSKYLDIIDQEPIDGYDLVTTIDVNMQDIAENALKEKLVELNADMGVVILMEVKTGDVKAIVNLQRFDDGNYYDARNFALAALMEPGSTFKTASIMVALDDGMITINDKVDTKDGIYNMYGAKMKDWNWYKGGYHVIDVVQCLKYSSNVGVSRIIDEHYHSNPAKFVEGLHRIGIGTPLDLPFVGAANPNIRMPKADKSNWSNTALPWMSIGYETQIPPISTVTFYNAIANNGTMVRPRFVKAIQKNGETIEEFPVEVIKEKICKESTLKDIQGILMRIVNDKDGTGKRAGSKHFHVSGKTGTAQVSQGRGGYKNGTMQYLVSFCGYYPSEDPKYSCIVAIRKPGYPASGGGMAGPVFSKIAERIFSKNVSTDITTARDSSSVFVPEVMNGDISAASSVLNDLNIKHQKDGDGAWGTADTKSDTVAFTSRKYGSNVVPDVTGMGARDAVFAMESRGIKARISGAGAVKSQSLAAGTKVAKGQTVTLYLERKKR